MKQKPDASDDEGAILMCFADFLENDGIEGLALYLTHCKIRMVTGLTAGDAILAHYRNPIGYDIERVAMDLRMWKPVADRIWQLMNEKAERAASADRDRKRLSKPKAKGMNGHDAAGIAI